LLSSAHSIIQSQSLD